MRYEIKLSEEEQLKLICDWQDNESQEAFKAMYDTYLDLMKVHANDYKNKGLEFEEKLSICQEAFLDCMRKFKRDNDSENFSFEYMLNLCIPRAIKHELALLNKHPGVGKCDYEMLNKINIVWDQLIDEADPGVEVGLQQVAENLDISLEYIEKLMRIPKYAGKSCSLDFEITPSLKVSDTLADDQNAVYTSSNLESFKEKMDESYEVLSKSQSATHALIDGNDDLASQIFDRQVRENPALRVEVIATYGDIIDDDLDAPVRDEIYQFVNNIVRECKKPMPRILKKNLGLI